MDRTRLRRGRDHQVSMGHPPQALRPRLRVGDVRHLTAAAEAAARGDVRGALEHELAGPRVDRGLAVARLRDLLAVGEQAPGWAYSRWCVCQAGRWMLLAGDPRADSMVRETLVAVHADRLVAIASDPKALRAYGIYVATGDWVFDQLAVYERGGLQEFLDLRAEAGLLDRADRVRDWAAASMGVYAVVGAAGRSLVLRDLASGTETDALNVGSLSGRAAGAGLIGRLVPISVAPYRMFDSRPISVDAETAGHAVDLLRAGVRLGWLRALSRARDRGRLPLGFSRRAVSLFTSDLIVDPIDACARDETG